jgi:homoserine kinase
MPDSLALVDALRARGVAAVVSGAGPTVLALARRAGGAEDGDADAAGPDAAGPDAARTDAARTDADDAIAAVFGGAMGGWRVLPLAVDRQGASVHRVAPSPAR